MKYSESPSKSKFTGSAAFYIIIACCLVAIGGASWFAVSNYNKDENPPQSSSQNSRNSSYPDNSSAYNSSIANPSALTPSADVAEPVKDEPYTSSTTTESSAPKVASNSFSMPVQGEIIKNYNEKELQYSATYGDMRIHTGIDIACENGTAVSSCGNGTVVAVEDSSTLGKVVTIDHGNGITVKYACLKDVKIQNGKTVSVGDIIGSVETIPCEMADQSHLHIEVYKNGHLASPLATLGLE